MHCKIVQMHVETDIIMPVKLGVRKTLFMLPITFLGPKD